MEPLRDSQLTVLWMSGRTYQRGEAVALHQHEFNQLQLVLSGEEHVQLADRPYTVFGGQLYLVTPRTPHAFKFNHDAVIIDIKFTTSPDLQRLLNQVAQLPIFPVSDRESFRRLLTQALAAQRQPTPYGMLRVDVRLKDLLLTLVVDQNGLVTPIPEATYMSPDTSFAPLRYLQQHYATPLRLADLARHFHYSKNYMIEICKRETGVTPNTLLQLIRIRHVKNYLAYTELSINDIAIHVGLDANYLTRLFKQQVGQSPLKYRQTIQAERRQNITLLRSFDHQQQPKIHQSKQ
ncbi:AraC family transcriptional regulator [Levilactobacillus zymae]|uniref:AraC family transcriptional regulator n=1 Tax=Levilactobacillus zymae TaxID=267363 RepID=UPI003FCE2923